MSVQTYYELDLKLLDKTIGTPTNINTGRIVNGDLTPFRARLELVNTGNTKADHGVIILRVPPDGTFVRTEPILVNEEAKDKYVIQAQIKQPDGVGGIRRGKTFRFTIGAPTIQDDPMGGEQLKISLLSMEYRLKEHLTSKQLPFFSPKEAFTQRLLDYNQTKGSSETAVLYDTDDIDLPDTEANLKWSYNPLAPTKTWDLLHEIIVRLSQPAVSGGTFRDYFFDMEGSTVPPFNGDPTTGDINVVDVKAGIFGDNDSGIVIDPLALSSPIDAEKDKTIMTDLTKFKNNIIMEGDVKSGSLPMDRARFNSYWQHGQARDEWSGSGVYYNGLDGINPQSVVKRTDTQVTSSKEITRYFKYIGGTQGASGADPISIGQSDWHEDFTIIPEWSQYAEYEEFDVVYTISAGTVEFWEVDAGKTPTMGDSSPTVDTENQWSKTFNDIPESQHEPFFSYTPWTSDYWYQKNNLFGTPQIPLYNSGTTYAYKDEVQYSGKTYISTVLTATNTGNQPDVSPLQWEKVSDTVETWEGCVPDWNLERANFDRVKADDQFEQVSFKTVRRVVGTGVTADPSTIPADEIVNGARFLLNTTGVGDWLGASGGNVAEWFQPPFKSTGEWKFSKSPTTDDLVNDINTAQIRRWNGVNWEVIWSPLPNNATTSSPWHAVTTGNILGARFANISKMGFGLVKGSTQIPAQAIRLTFHWDQVYGSYMNLSSRGAWWVQYLPIPYGIQGSKTIGEAYANSTLDATNLDRDSKGNQGWNNGVDSEDLGRISSLTMKVRLSMYDRLDHLVNGYANIPFKAWALDVFGRIWYYDFSVKRNGQYDFVRILFGKNAPQRLHHNRIDELFTALGFEFSQNFFLKEKQFTGIEFDWRFVKCWGIMYNGSYDDNGMYIGVRDNFVDTLSAWAHQAGNYVLNKFGVPKESYVVDHVQLDIDELGFEKQLFANSDNVKISNARTELAHNQGEVDYLNLKLQAEAQKARKEFVNQQWHMSAHGDVRMRIGEAFKITGSRVPEQTTGLPTYNLLNPYNKGDKVQQLGYVWKALQDVPVGKLPNASPEFWANLNESVCAEVKHIIDSDGYKMEILGVRKFVFSG